VVVRDEDNAATSSSSAIPPRIRFLSRPALADGRLRRDVAYAIDRRALAAS
jgi:hypothetical protein